MPVLVSLSRTKEILVIGLPIVGGMISNVLLGLIDTAMVGSLGDAALGAVGLSSFAAFIYLGMVYGFSIAVQATVSRRRGEKREAECGVPLQGAMMTVAIIAPICSAVLYVAIPSLFPLINSDPEVVALGVDYIRWLFLQAVFIGFIAANTGFWNGLGRSRVYIPSLVLMHLSNILFNYMFIFGNLGAPDLGAEGAGLATALSSVVGSLLFLRLGLKFGRPYGFLTSRPTIAEIRALLRLAIPAGLQQVFDTAALTATYSIVGMVGTRELACYSVLVNFIGLVGLPAWGLGTAGVTLVGNALGERRPAEAAKWAWDVVKLGVVGMFILGMPFWLFPDAILSIWIHDPETRALAVTPTRILGIMIAFNGIGYMMATLLNGAGDVKRVTWINLVTQWCVLVPGAFLFGPYLGFGLLGIWSLHQFGYRAGNSIIFALIWRKGKWSKIVI